MWFAFLLAFVGGVIIVWVGWLGLTGRLPRQHLAGIRTPYALSSDERWGAVHRHAGPYLVLGGAATAAAAAALLPFSVANRLPEGFAVAALLAIATAAVGSTVAAWLLGVAAARRELGE